MPYLVAAAAIFSPGIQGISNMKSTSVKGVNMKNVLSYQTSEYDCGPTTLLNAMRYLFEREEIVPDILKAISLYTLDEYNSEGESGKSGTSRMAMMYLSKWFNQFGETKHFPIYTEMLLNELVWIKQNSRIIGCLQQGGTVIIRCWLEGYQHYVLLTGIEEEYVCLFDPYDYDSSVDGVNIIKVNNEPRKMNRKVRMDIFNEESTRTYAFGNISNREAMLLYNAKSRITPEKSIEYFI